MNCTLDGRIGCLVNTILVWNLLYYSLRKNLQMGVTFEVPSFCNPNENSEGAVACVVYAATAD